MSGTQRRELIRLANSLNNKLDRYEKALHRIVKCTKAYELTNELARDALNKGEK